MRLSKEFRFIIAVLMLIKKLRCEFSFGASYCYPASKCIKDEFGNATSIDLGYCGAAFSCHNATTNNNTHITDFGSCSASHSCSYNTIKEGFNYYCSAVASCASLTIIAPYVEDALSNDMNCDADQSCSHSHITGQQNIHARGAYSLLNTIVDSKNCAIPRYGKNRYNLFIEFSGYHAGLNAKIICRHNHTCFIGCHANGCFNTSLQCDGLCQVNTSSADTIHPIYVQEIDPYQPTPFAHNFSLLYDSYILSIENDEECRKLARNYTFDDYDEALDVRGLHLTGGIKWDIDIPVCCRGSWSCEDAYNVIKSEFINQRTICSGEYACIYDEHIFNTNGPIFCEAKQSCFPGNNGMTVNTSKTLYCLGSQSCESSYQRVLDLHNAERFICSGVNACKRANIFTSGLGKTHSIYLLGQNSGELTQIHCLSGDTCYILCWSYRACLDTTLYCNGTCIIECDADTLCPFDSVSQQYFYPTFAPTLEPTTDPTKDPTIDPTNDPTMSPSNAPSFTNIISAKYSASFILEQHDINKTDAVEIERKIIIAFYNSSIQILSADVMYNGVVLLEFIVATNEYNTLDVDIVSGIIEAELKDELGDINVYVVEENDPTEDEEHTLNVWMFIAIIATAVAICILCVFLAFIHFTKQKKEINDLAIMQEEPNVVAETKRDRDNGEIEEDKLEDDIDVIEEEGKKKDVAHDNAPGEASYEDENNLKEPSAERTQEGKTRGDFYYEEYDENVHQNVNAHKGTHETQDVDLADNEFIVRGDNETRNSVNDIFVKQDKETNDEASEPNTAEANAGHRNEIAGSTK